MRHYLHTGCYISRVDVLASLLQPRRTKRPHEHTEDRQNAVQRPDARIPATAPLRSLPCTALGLRFSSV